MTKIKLALNIIRTYKNWYDAFLDHASLFPMYKKKIYYVRNGIMMETRAGTTDLGTMHTTFIGKENDHMLEKLCQTPVIIDIGAHIGLVSIYIAKKITGAMIYSYEPFPENYELLRRNIEINGLSHTIKPFNKAVFNKKGRKKLYFRRRYNAGCTLLGENNKESESIFVDCTTVRDIFETNKIKTCDLLKVDCEGADYYILKSIPSRYMKRIKMIHAEFHRKYQIILMKDLLEKHGFSIDVSWFTTQYGNIFAVKNATE